MKTNKICMACKRSRVRISYSPLRPEDKKGSNDDKSRKIKVLRDFFLSLVGHPKDTKKPRKDEVALLKPLLKRLTNFSNDLRHKSLIRRLLS